MESLSWAVGLSMLSAASYAAAAVAQERLAEHGHRGPSRWAGALLLTAGGVLLHVVALNFASVAVVQALGTLTLLFALPITHLRYQTEIGLAGWVEATLTVAGLALIMSLSVESTRPTLLSTAEDGYLSLIILVVVVALTGWGWFSGPRMKAVLLAGAAGIAFGIASVLSKSVLAELTSGGPGEVSIFALSMVVIASIAGYGLSQLSYRGAGLAAPLATVSVTNPIAAAVTGVVVFGEGFRFGAIGLVIVGVAAAAITVGVIGLSRRAAVGTTPDPSPVSPSHAEPRPSATTGVETG